MRRLLALPLLLVLCAVAWAGEEPVSASDVTERGRDIDRILDMILVPEKGAGDEGRVLVLLLDVTASLQQSDFAGELAVALERNARQLAGTRIGVACAGDEGGFLLEPTARRELVAQTVQEVCAKARTAFQNVYGDVRRVLPALRREKGRREIVLVTLENGDAEDDVEQTVQELERAEVRLSVVAREAFLSDSLWILRPPRGPPGTRFTGPENAFPDIPWGWRFQWIVPNNTILSGFAMHGLTRLAAATGGRVYLFYPATGLKHFCVWNVYYTRCLFCDKDHQPEGQVYQSQRLRAISPLAVSRREVYEHALSDPYYRAVQRAWEQMSKKGIVYSRPSLERRGASVRREPYPYRGWNPLGGTAAFDSEASRGRRLLVACQEVLRDLEDGIERATASGGSERYRAIAETTRLLLHVTRFNLLLYVTYCAEVGPEHATRGARSYEPPERAPYGEDPQFRWIGYVNLSLCHGVAPFRAVRFPGGETIARELRELQTVWDAFVARWKHTPFDQMVRRAGLAKFYLVLHPGYIPPGKRRVPDTATDDTVTLPERPARPRRPGSGTSGGAGPTTGE